VKPALYVLAGVVATLAYIGFGVLLVQMMTDLFGIYGLIIEMAVLFSLAGGYPGWLIWRQRSGRNEPHR
jgi:hypothetical protein